MTSVQAMFLMESVEGYSHGFSNLSPGPKTGVDLKQKVDTNTTKEKEKVPNIIITLWLMNDKSKYMK